MATTRIVEPVGFGGPEQLRLTEIETPLPGPGEVRITVTAIGVNPIDWKLYSGAFGTNPSLLHAIGSEAAGVVDVVGDDVTAWHQGDAVIATVVPGTAYADAIVVPASGLIAQPAGMSAEQAAGLPVVAGTAAHAVQAVGLAAGDTVVIHGAAGGVGGLTVQLARRRGARVIATASAANHDYLRSLGAEPVAYGDGLEGRIRALAPEGVDAAIDAVGTDEALETSVAIVADPQRVVTMAGMQRAAELGIKAIGAGPGADPGEDIRRAARPEVIALVAAGELSFPIARTYPLADTAEAHRDSQAGHTRGKLVVLP